MELQSVGSDEGRENKENQAPLENGQEGMKSRRGGEPRRDGEAGGSHSSGSSSQEEEGEEHITKRYQERGTGDGDMSAPTSQSNCGVNGTVEPASDDETEEIGRASCRERVFRLCRSRWSPYH